MFMSKIEKLLKLFFLVSLWNYRLEGLDILVSQSEALYILVS